MSDLAILAACVVIGLLPGRSSRLPERGPAAFDATIVDALFPAPTGSGSVSLVRGRSGVAERPRNALTPRGGRR